MEMSRRRFLEVCGLGALSFASVGVRNITVTGELRFDQPVPSHLVSAARTLRPLLVMVLRMDINDCVTSVAPASYSRQPRRMVSFALSTIAVFISGV